MYVTIGILSYLMLLGAFLLFGRFLRECDEDMEQHLIEQR